MAENALIQKGLGHSSKSLSRSLKCLAALCLLVLNKHKNVDVDTIDSYLLGKEGYVFGSVGLSVCLFVCGQQNSKRYERIGMKFLWRFPG